MSKGLGNPVVKAELGIFVAKIAVVGIIGYIVYRKFINSFTTWSENNNYPSSNITTNQAAAKAETIYTAMYGLGNGFDVVKTQLAGVNYNGFVRIYNAFGNRSSANVIGSKMNLIEWFSDQYDSEELDQIRFLLPGII